MPLKPWREVGSVAQGGPDNTKLFNLAETRPSLLKQPVLLWVWGCFQRLLEFRLFSLLVERLKLNFLACPRKKHF